MAAAATVLYQVAEGVGTVTLNQPDRANAIDHLLCAELAAVLATAAADPQVRALVLTGAGPHFSAGGDLELIRTFLDADPAEVEESVARSLAVIRVLYELRKPTIARVQGAAVGGGCALALACDFIVAAETASFRFPFVDLGIVPDLGTLYLLPRKIGAPRAKELCYLGGSLTAAEALAAGLVSRVTPAVELDAATAALARSLAAKPAPALALMKGILQAGLQADLKSVLDHEAGAQALLWQTAETRRRVRQAVARVRGDQAKE